MSRVAKTTEAQSDLLLWVGAGAIVAIAIAWFALSWLGGSTPATVAVEPDTALALGPDPEPEALLADDGATTHQDATGSTLDNPLRAAQMAFEAGMLTEPENYSAWTLFGKALDGDPDSAGARDGLERVAEELLTRGSTAFEQGRYDDASAIADQILARLPENEGAIGLRDEIAAAEARRLERQKARQAAQAARADDSAGAGRGDATSPRGEGSGSRSGNARETEELLAKYDDGFKAAVQGNRLLAPDEDSAKHFVVEMREIAADDPRTTAAADWLITEMLGRSRQAAEATDWTAAETWIAEAEKLGAGPDLLAGPKDYLADQVAAAESAKRLPASELKLAHYVAPDYPRTAASRGIEGWVDIDFTVTAEGNTTDVVVTDSSNGRLFQSEAIQAVSEWSFEPRTFQGRPIDQNVYTRVRFIINN